MTNDVVYMQKRYEIWHTWYINATLWMRWLGDDYGICLVNIWCAFIASSQNGFEVDAQYGTDLLSYLTFYTYWVFVMLLRLKIPWKWIASVSNCTPLPQIPDPYFICTIDEHTVVQTVDVFSHVINSFRRIQRGAVHISPLPIQVQTNVPESPSYINGLWSEESPNPNDSMQRGEIWVAWWLLRSLLEIKVGTCHERQRELLFVAFPLGPFSPSKICVKSIPVAWISWITGTIMASAARHLVIIIAFQALLPHRGHGEMGVIHESAAKCA